MDTRKQMDDSLSEIIYRKYDFGKPIVIISKELNIRYVIVGLVINLYIIKQVNFFAGQNQKLVCEVFILRLCEIILLPTYARIFTTSNRTQRFLVYFESK